MASLDVEEAYVTLLMALTSPCHILTLSQLDNHGRRLLLSEEASLNIPAVAAAHVVKRYTAQAPDELSFEVRLDSYGLYLYSLFLLPFPNPLFYPFPGGRHCVSDRHATHRGSELVAGQTGLSGELGEGDMCRRARCPPGCPSY